MNPKIYEMNGTLLSLNIKDEKLGDYLELPSSDIIYSNTDETLKKGKFYFIGFNPGGEQDENLTIKDAIEKLDRDHNVYLIPYRQNIASGKFEKLQKRFQNLMELLDIDPNSIFCTNLIFEASKNISELKYVENKKNICWKLHEKFLDIVQPQIILCNGNSASSSYSYIKTLLQDRIEDADSKYAAGHGKWEIKSCKGNINERRYLVIGIPHLSYYAPSTINSRKHEAIKFIKAKINSA